MCTRTVNAIALDTAVMLAVLAVAQSRDGVVGGAADVDRALRRLDPRRICIFGFEDALSPTQAAPAVALQIERLMDGHWMSRMATPIQISAQNERALVEMIRRAARRPIAHPGIIATAYALGLDATRFLTPEPGARAVSHAP